MLQVSVSFCGFLALLLGVFLRSFLLLLVSFLQHLRLFLRGLVGAARVLLRSHALRAYRRGYRKAPNEQHRENNNSFHNLSERTVLLSILHRGCAATIASVLLL